MSNKTIIPYQEPPGNYNTKSHFAFVYCIIPYQEPPGNYNYTLQHSEQIEIIPYQEPPGNYNLWSSSFSSFFIIPYQEPPGNYNKIIVYILCVLLYHTKNHRGTTTTRHLLRTAPILYHTKKPLRTKRTSFKQT